MMTPSWLHDVSCYRDSYQRTLLDCYSSVSAETSYGYYYHNNDLALVCESPASTTPAYSYDSSGK